jgi:hypothetical protein
MKDALGNELRKEDLVALQLDRPLIFGQVVEVVEGGLVTSGNQIAPGRIVILSRHTIDFDPRQPLGAVVALRDNHNRAQDIAPGESPSPLPN